MRCSHLATAMVMFSAISIGLAQDSPVATKLKAQLAPHPRLLFSTADEKTLADRTQAEPRLAKLRQRVLADADLILTLPELKRQLTGRRLLIVSRDALHRIATLSLAKRLTGERKYLDGAKANLRALVAFSDFNPQHFLDVAEASAAMAIGYDWLYADLSDAERAAIRNAIITKGLKPSFTDPPATWVRGKNNWNQVCHGGLTLAALAIAEDEPGLAEKTITRAIDSVPTGMQAYLPDGAYPEGASYWSYGTSYSALMIAGLRSALGDDFGLGNHAGLLKSADFRLHIIGPTQLAFSYCDMRQTDSPVNAPAYFLAGLRNDRSLLFNETKALDARLAKPVSAKDYYSFDWLIYLWYGDGHDPATPQSTYYAANGPTPVALHRTSWQADATYVGIHGGRAGGPHGHMDIGSFVLDMSGFRVAGDLGAQDYESLESRKFKLFDMTQASDRWRVFRLGAMSHNILTVNGLGQSVSGKAEILKTTPEFTVLDLAPVYAGQLAKATRGIQLRPDKSVRIQDDIQAPPATDANRPAVVPVTIRWAMLTAADVQPDGPRATLTSAGQRVTMVVRSPAGATIEIVRTDPPPNDFDAPNPGTRLVTFSVKLSPDKAEKLVVDFIPDGVKDSADAVRPLTDW